MDLKKIEGILAIVDTYGIPLMEQGVKVTKNVEDDVVVAFLKGGIPEVRKKLDEIEKSQAA